MGCDIRINLSGFLQVWTSQSVHAVCIPSVICHKSISHACDRLIRSKMLHAIDTIIELYLQVKIISHQKKIRRERVHNIR